jgi:glycosyltransferase involved in cell wall biosynthesis
MGAMANAKLSVMMITYNHEPFIAQAIQSALEQRTDFDYEIVIGEDCSTDRTREIVMDFHHRYPDRIVPLVREKNLGMMRNVRETLSACRGQYIAFLEGDDYWTSRDKLQRQVDFLDSHPDYAICCGRVRILDEMGAVSAGMFSSAGVLPSEEAGTYTMEDLLRGNFIYTCTSVCCWGMLRDLPTWFEEMKLGDWPLHILVAQFGKIELMDGVLAVYRVHSGGIWSFRPAITKFPEIIRMFEALDRELKFQHTRRIRTTIAGLYGEWGMAAVQNGDRLRGARCLVNCVRNTSYDGLPTLRPKIRALTLYTLLGSLYPTLARAKRAVLQRVVTSWPRK